MDFDLTNEQRDIKGAARDFATGEFTDVARDYDLNEIFPREILNKARELGFLGLFIPEEYGGPGFGFLEHALVLEEFWRVDPGIVVVAQNVKRTKRVAVFVAGLLADHLSAPEIAESVVADLVVVHQSHAIPDLL